MDALFLHYPPRQKKADDPKLRDAVFAVLHSPPSAHGINRTSWTMRVLKKALADEGMTMSMDVLRTIVRKGGYRWKMARTVLTSNDPQYREKVDRIKSVLSRLRDDERFFSIDEFGPFAVKMRGGCRLVGPGETPIVPQFAKSKGFLIVTAALELSRNQVTHFYSEKKNTAEMVKLIRLLVKQYAGCRTLYLTWDAASWHSSKALHEFIDENNADGARRTSSRSSLRS